jgi:glycosyltransferase involved in cell wall biosynthesis
VPTSLLIVTGIFPPDVGGPSKFAMDFGNWACSKDLDVSVQTYSEKGITAEQLGYIKVFYTQRQPSLFFRYLKMIFSIGRMAIRKNSVIAIGAFLETYIASMLFRFDYSIKVPGDIVWERARNNKLTELSIDDFQKVDLNLKYRIFRKLYSNSLKKARVVIVPSLGLYNLCATWGVKHHNIRMIHNSVENSSPASLTNSEPEFDLVTVCRLTPWKGVDEIIKYCIARDLKLVVVGDGPERFRLESQSKKLNAKITFVGNVLPQQVDEILRKSRLFVLNSYYEGLPHALVEARAAGVLSVGRAGTGSEEVISDGIDGYLIRPDRTLEQTLDLALSSIQISGSIIERAKADTTSRFNREVNFQKILNEIIG